MFRASCLPSPLDVRGGRQRRGADGNQEKRERRLREQRPNRILASAEQPPNPPDEIAACD